MEKLLQSCVHLLEAGESFALAVIVESHGSTPRGAGAVMAVRRDGSIAGTVGGGVLEARAVKAGIELLNGGGGRLLSFDLTNANAAESEMICGGSGRMAIVKVGPEARPVFSAALEAARSGGNGFLAVAWPPEERGDGWSVSFTGEGPGAGVYPAGDGGGRCLLPVHSGGRLLLLGAGHVSREIAALAHHLGFQVTVMDDREEFANAQRFPDCTVQVLEDMDCPPAMALDQDDYVIVVTRGHIHDLNCLEWAMHTGAGYLGMMGSRRKKEMIFAALEARGIAPAALERVYTPIGLDIKAQTPAEIAVSVAAELIEKRAVRNGTQQETGDRERK